MRCTALLFGRPRFEWDGVVFEPRPTKASALLCYLVLNRDWCTRAELILHFYPDTSDDAARVNLRQLLAKLRRLPYTRGLESRGDLLRWTVETDVEEYRRAIRYGDLASAARLLNGELLDGFSTLPEPQFTTWLDEQRAELHGLWRDLVMRSLSSLPTGEAFSYLRELLQQDPLDEEALQVYLGLAGSARHKASALRAYRQFSLSLEREFGLEPTQETRRLAAQLQAADFVASEPGRPLPPAWEQRTAVPLVGSTFVGRRRELQAIRELLETPDCRLLTIVGAGGMGKTRLALEAARSLYPSSFDSRVFVGLDSLRFAAGIPATIATSMGLELADDAPALHRVVTAIGSSKTLLIHDNFEHLIEGATICLDLLRECRNLKLLASSRHRLELSGEWLFELEGLTVAASDSDPDLSADAVSLFLSRARQLRHGFNPDPTDLSVISRITSLLSGSPLAIELAATWASVMGCSEIEDELKQGIDLLHTTARDLPERQQSMRATLEHSWGLLSPVEQEALKRLSVFTGGFTRAGASAVADVPVALLLALIGKSWLRVTHGGRYDRHALLHQFTREKLAQHPEALEAAEERQGLYFLRWIRDLYGDLQTPRRGATLALIEGDRANLSSAWRWAVRAGRVAEIEAATWAVDAAFGHRPIEGRALIAEAIASLDEHDPAHKRALAHLLIQQGHYLYNVKGADAEHDASIEKGLALFRQTADMHGLMRGLVGLRVGQFMKGDLAGARRTNEEGLALARAHGTARDLSIYLANLVAVERELLAPEAFVERCREVLRELELIGDTVSRARLLVDLGDFLEDMGRSREGEALLEEGLNAIRESGDRSLEPLGLLALRASRLDKHQESEDLARENLTYAQRLGHSLHRAHAYVVSARVAMRRGDDDTARQELAHALRYAWFTHHRALATQALLMLAEVHAAGGNAKSAAAYVGLAQQQPTFFESHRRLAGYVLSLLTGKLTEAELTSAIDRGSALSFEEVVVGHDDT